MRAAALLPVLVLYVLVGWTSPGYDDEIFTIAWIEAAAGVRDLLATIASRDTHPPGSYLIGMGLARLGLGWSEIRALAGGVTALALWGLWRVCAPAGRAGAAFAWMAICLNPTVLLWGATLRWYSFFLPLFIALIVLVVVNPVSRWRFWGAFCAASAGLVWLGYLALVLLPAMLAAALWRRRRLVGGEWVVMAGFAGLWAMAVAPQLLLVLPQQLDRGIAVHAFGPARRMLGAAMHVLAGQASMPLSLGAVAFALGNLALLGLGLRRAWGMPGTIGAIFFLGGLAGAGAAGITGHFRSLVVLVPAQAMWQGALFGAIRGRVPRAAVALCFAVGTLAGLANVIGHSDTTKGSWNTPYAAILSAIEAARRDCPSLAVTSFDPVLAWHLGARGIALVPASGPGFEALINDAAACLATVETFRGRTPAELHRRFAEAIAARPGPRRVVEFGPDRHAWFKRRFDPDVPDHAARLTVFPGPAAPRPDGG